MEREEGLGRDLLKLQSATNTHKKTASFAHPLPGQYTGYKVSEIRFLSSWPDMAIPWPEAGERVPASLLVTPS